MAIESVYARLDNTRLLLRPVVPLRTLVLSARKTKVSSVAVYQGYDGASGHGTDVCVP